MYFNQSLDAIQPLLDSFSILHHIWLKFVSCTGEYILTPEKRPQSEFCRFIRANPEGLKRCRASVQKCMHLDPYKPHLFPCHAGLFILAVPLHSKGDFIGALATGEIRTSDTLSERIKILEKVQDLNFNSAKLLELYEKLALTKHDEIMILGESLHTISNCLLELGIAHGNAGKTIQITENDIYERDSLIIKDSPLSWSQKIVQQACTYILDNFSKPLSLKEVARQVHLSPTYFSYLFSQEQKETFSSFLIKTRLEKAKELLTQFPCISISEISSQIGYSDSNYFSRIFKKNIGMSPSLYRTRMYSSTAFNGELTID